MVAEIERKRELELAILQKFLIKAKAELVTTAFFCDEYKTYLDILFEMQKLNNIK